MQIYSTGSVCLHELTCMHKLMYIHTYPSKYNTIGSPKRKLDAYIYLRSKYRIIMIKNKRDKLKCSIVRTKIEFIPFSTLHIRRGIPFPLKHFIRIYWRLLSLCEFFAYLLSLLICFLLKVDASLG